MSYVNLVSNKGETHPDKWLDVVRELDEHVVTPSVSNKDETHPDKWLDVVRELGK